MLSNHKESHGFNRGSMSKAHRNGMRISRICAWGTSKLAFDGSGRVLREEDAGLTSYSNGS